MYQHIQVPLSGGKNHRVNPDFSLNVSDHPIIPFIEGDGIGIDVTPVMRKVIDAAVEKAYAGKRKIEWWKFMPERNHSKSTVKTSGFRKETLDA